MDYEAFNEVERYDVEDTVETKEIFIGVVTNCNKLNVRQKPNGEILTVISKGSIVIIDIEDVTDDWYKIFTEDEISGYCMAKFIEIEE